MRRIFVEAIHPSIQETTMLARVSAALLGVALFAGLFVLAGLGVALYAIFSVVEGRVTGWATRKNDAIAT
jgi:ABC-type nitrate/sulfonate/bicarbonate transport system permease component